MTDAANEVLYTVADHIATITLNAPERMNTISDTQESSSAAVIGVGMVSMAQPPPMKCTISSWSPAARAVAA